MGYRLSPQAVTDVDEIIGRIANEDMRAADRFLARMTKKFTILGNNPRIGRARPDIREDLRSSPYGNYLVLIREIADGTEIVRFVHAARDLHEIF